MQRLPSFLSRSSKVNEQIPNRFNVRCEVSARRQVRPILPAARCQIPVSAVETFWWNLELSNRDGYFGGASHMQPSSLMLS